jgi:hypothetical protein
MMNPGTVPQLVGLTAGLALSMAGRAAGMPAEIDDVLRLVPPKAPAAVVIPSVKAASDQLTQCLEGMDRAGAMLGSRPIDQLKSATGFNIGIRDSGGMAIVFSIDPALREMPLFLVPVNDAATFLQGNFVAHDGDAHKLANGTTLYAKAVGAHVALSESPDHVRGYDAGAGAAGQLQQALGDRAGPLLQGELVAFAQAEAIRLAAQELRREAAQREQRLSLIAVGGFTLMDQTEFALISVDLDPLGAVFRSLTRLSADGAFKEFAAGGANSAAGPNRVPGRPFYLAASADFAGLGLMQAMATQRAKGMNDLPEWLDQVRQVQMAVYPSPLGMAGGVLNDAALLLTTSDPASAREGLKAVLAAGARPGDPVKLHTKWEDGRTVKDVGVADAYEIKVLDAPAEAMQAEMAMQMLFGRAGARGFVRQIDQGLIITFSQRPAVLQAALAAASAAPEAPGGVAAMPAVRSMREWLPRQSDIEVFLGMGQIAELATQLAATFGGAGVGPLPQLAPTLPPIAFGAAVQDHRIETATIIPAGVLAVLLDEALRTAKSGNPLAPPADDHGP